MTLQLNDLEVLDVPALASTGLPLQLAIDTIDEDPSQPRLQFDDEPLRELASSITERGVLQAISVRPHSQQPGRWILNFGARRLRASRLAGRSTIPAFVNQTADSYGQFIENEQREGLKPLELALFVQQRLASGESQADIARQMSKSRAYVTYATALIDAPDWLMSAYREGRCRGLHELYELRRLHDTAPRSVEDWLRVATTISRTEVAALKEKVRRDALGPNEPLEQPASPPAVDEAERPTEETMTREASGLIRRPSNDPAGPSASHRASPREASRQPPTRPSARASGQTLAVTLWGTHAEAEVIIDLSAAPGDDGQVYVIRAADGQRQVVAAADIRLRRVVEGTGA